MLPIRSADGGIAKQRGRVVAVSTQPRHRWYLFGLLVLTAMTFAVGWAQKLPCQVHGYGPGNTYAYTRLCYSDVYVAWTSEGLDEGKRPYLDHPVEYPVLLGGLMAMAAVGADNADEFFDHTAALLLPGALIVMGTTALLLGPSRRRDAVLVALAPGMVLHGTVSWDLAAAAMAGLALLAWSRRRPALAGVALGIGAAVKLYPILFLLPLLILCLRRKDVRRWIESFVAAVGTWVFCNGVAGTMAGTFVITENEAPRNAVLRFFVFNRDRPADWDSVWFVAQAVMRGLTNDPEWAFPVPIVNIGSAVLLLAGLVALAAVLCRPRVPASSAQAVFLATAIFVLTSKVFSPQFCIWLIPLAVLAGVKWTPFFVWQVVEVALVYVRFSYFHHLQVPSAGLPLRFFVVAVVARDIALLNLVYGVIRDIRCPPPGEPPRSFAGGPATNRLVPTTSAA